MTIKEVGRWISVDGVEAAGKTTISDLLCERLGGRVAPEFSDAGFGRALQGAVRDTPHFISTSALGQSLVFLGDFFEVHGTVVAPTLAEGGTVISDRGYVSKFAYQAAVLESSLPGVADALIDRILGLIDPPDLTVYLHAPLEVIRRRLQIRDGSCSAERLAFIATADKLARARLAREPRLTHVLIDTDRPAKGAIRDLMRAIEKSAVMPEPGCASSTGFLTSLPGDAAP